MIKMLIPLMKLICVYFWTLTREEKLFLELLCLLLRDGNYFFILLKKLQIISFFYVKFLSNIYTIKWYNLVKKNLKLFLLLKLKKKKSYHFW